MTNKLLTKIGTGMATGALLLGIAASSAFAAGPKISNTGAFSFNQINVTTTNIKTTTQSNTNTITNLVDVEQDTGGNTSSFNGGGTLIKSGSNYSSVFIYNGAPMNVIK